MDDNNNIENLNNIEPKIITNSYYTNYPNKNNYNYNNNNNYNNNYDYKHNNNNLNYSYSLLNNNSSFFDVQF